MHVRRRQPCLIEVDDELRPDFAALLQGTMRLDPVVKAALPCPLTGRRIPLSADELALVARLPAEGWQPVDALAAAGPLDREDIVALAARGALASDDTGPAATAVRDGEAALDAVGWHPLAAVYHALSRWHGVVGDEGVRDHGDPAQRDRLAAHGERHGPVPPHNPRREDALARVRLPDEPFADAFADVLRARRTTRHFDVEARLPLAALGRVLHGCFGVLGEEELAPGVVAQRRSSPSGGGLHPVEAYPLIVRVDGLPPGLYHYEGDSHALALLEPMDEDAARALASQATIGQHYFAEAHALVFHVARVDRHHWKYRNHPKAYKALLLDSGHLSQAFYLLAAERGLGAFYTAAVNDGDLGQRFGLDPLREIVVAANGLGIVDPGRDALHLKPRPPIAR
jgi:putative peptide maturation dehydrogenase